MANVPVLTVTYENDENELVELKVKATIKDMSSYELAASRQNWPTTPQGAPMLWSAYLAWSALRRDPNAPTRLKTANVDDFLDVVEMVGPADEEEPVDPTRADHGSAPA